MSRNISKESLYGNLHWKKRTFSTPKTTRWISFAKKKHLHLKKKDAPKNTWTETVYQKNSEESHQNKSEERSLPKTFRRDISSKKINVFEEKFLPKKKRKSYKNSKQKIICRKTTQRKLCIFQEKTLRNKIWRDICNWIRAEKSLPKNVWEEILTKSLQEISPAKNLRREISSKESQEQIHEISEKKSLQKQPSRDISKISLKRNFYRTSIWQFFFRNTIPKESQRIFYQVIFHLNKIHQKAHQKLSPQNFWRWISTQKILPEKTFLQQNLEYKHQPTNSWRNVSTKKIWQGISTNKNHPDGNSLPKKPEDKSLPKKSLKKRFYQKSWRRNLY